MGRVHLTISAKFHKCINKHKTLNSGFPTPDRGEVPKNLKELCRVGILARVVKVFRLPDGRTSALLHLMKRAQPMELVETLSQQGLKKEVLLTRLESVLTWTVFSISY